MQSAKVDQAISVLKKKPNNFIIITYHCINLNNLFRSWVRAAVDLLLQYHQTFDWLCEFAGSCIVTVRLQEMATFGRYLWLSKK
jgi:hypothetical protein